MSSVLLKKYTTVEQLDSVFWNEIGINFELINSQNNLDYLKQILRKYKIDVIKELLSLYKIDWKDKDEFDTLISKFNNLKSSQTFDILLLCEYLNRKSYSINHVYENHSNSMIYNTPLAKMLDLYYKNPQHLIYIYTYHQWIEKGSGNLLVLNKSISKEKIKKILTEYYDFFINYMYDKTDRQKYRIHSYYIDEQIFIINLYRQKNDITKKDFDLALRNKEVHQILINIDLKEKIIEIKKASQKEYHAIIEYFQSNFDVTVSEIEKTVFAEYDPGVINETFLGGEDVQLNASKLNIIVDGITFKRSTLKKSPPLSINLNKESILPAVKELKEKYIISDLKSLKDIDSLNVIINGKSKKIINRLSYNGNVYFTYDDSKMKKEERSAFNNTFKKLFNLPLFTEIANSSFVEGKAYKIDYLMNLNSPEQLEENELLIYSELKKEQFLDEVQESLKTCDRCSEVIDDSEKNACDCGCTILHETTNFKYFSNNKAIESFVLKKLKASLPNIGFNDTFRKSRQKLGNSDKEFLVFSNPINNEILQFFITDEVPTKKLCERINKLLIPTIFITKGLVGNKVEGIEEKGFSTISFGTLYSLDILELSRSLESYYKKIKHSLRSKISSAADTAYESINNHYAMYLTDPTLVEANYNKLFEDEVYCLLKDMISNSEKWGKEKSGQAYPEGIFAISAQNPGRNKSNNRVFSYDCKFTRKSDGYDLNMAEKRKALDYINTLNSSDYIAKFSDVKQLSAHIFISNKFQDSQITSMREYIATQLDENSKTKVIFLNIDILSKIHFHFRENAEFLTLEMNRFYWELGRLLDKEIPTAEDVENMFKRILDRELMDNKILATSAVSKELE